MGEDDFTEATYHQEDLTPEQTCDICGERFLYGKADLAPVAFILDYKGSFEGARMCRSCRAKLKAAEDGTQVSGGRVTISYPKTR